MTEDEKKAFLSSTHFTFARHLVGNIPIHPSKGLEHFKECFRLIDPWVNNYLIALLEDEINEIFTKSQEFIEELYQSFYEFLSSEEKIARSFSQEIILKLINHIKQKIYPGLKSILIHEFDILFFKYKHESILPFFGKRKHTDLPTEYYVDDEMIKKFS